MKYRAFISYSHTDRKWARRLHRSLESFRPPPDVVASTGSPSQRPLRPIFRDRDELPSTANLSDAVNEALAESAFLIVVCSPSAATSRWVNEEIRQFRRLGRGDRILCYVIDGEPAAGDERECFPPALTEPSDDGGAVAEPVAADARAEGDGRTNAMLKIAAGMLGVGFDALRQRDLRRRQQRMAAVTFGSLAIAAITVVLAVNAVIARDEAQTRRTQAEDLIDFMLGDLQEQLREIGRLDVFESVGDKALEYFSAQRAGDDTEYTLSQRARNLRQIGEIRMEQGDLEAALEAFEESLVVIDELAGRSPDNADAQIGRANGLFYVGYVHWQRGDLPSARASFESVIPIVNSVSATDPQNVKWLAERAYAYTNLGRVLELEGQYEAALGAYQGVMDVNQQLLVLEPDNAEWEMELGFAHNNIGKLVVALGDLSRSESHFRADLDIKSRIYAADTNHNVNRSYLAVSQYYLGQLLILRGATTEGLEHLTKARGHFSFLNQVDPDRHRWQVRRANIERELALGLAQAERYADALTMIDSAVATLERIVAGDEKNAGWRRELLHGLLVSADLQFRAGDRMASSAFLERAGPHLDFLLAQEPSNRDTRELSAYANICRARLDTGNGATQMATAALDTLDEFFPASSNPRILELRAVALDGASREPGGASIRAALLEIGYVGRGI